MVCDGDRSPSRKESGDNEVTCLEKIAIECGSLYEKDRSRVKSFLHGLCS